jgi:hypothetical protein
MIKRVAMVAVLAAAIAMAHRAQAQTFSATFPSPLSTVVASVGSLGGGEYGYFWSVARGDKVEETFVGTGLALVVQLDLDFDVSQNVLNSGAHVDWDVRVNGISVGGWSWHDGDGTGPVSLSYLLAPIVGAGNYTVGMFVTNEVAPGQGSIALREGRLKLTGHSGVVPEPGMWTMLLGFGVSGSVFCLRRRRK